MTSSTRFPHFLHHSGLKSSAQRRPIFQNQLLKKNHSSKIFPILCSILNFWKARSYDIGTVIQISDNKGGINMGTYLGLDEIGGLIVSDNFGTKKIYSGDVYFGS